MAGKEKKKKNKKTYLQKWKDEHPENVREYHRKYRVNHRESIRKSINKIKQTTQKKRKAKIFELLGNKCTNPYHLNHGDFLTDIRCLHIDHINSGGNKERHSFSCYTLYLKNVILKIQNGSKDYQLLCANCNFIKKYENKESRK